MRSAAAAPGTVFAARTISAAPEPPARTSRALQNAFHNRPYANARHRRAYGPPRGTELANPTSPDPLRAAGARLTSLSRLRGISGSEKADTVVSNFLYPSSRFGLVDNHASHSFETIRTRLVS